MAKTEIYSWRLTPNLKSALESAARREEVSLSALLERIATSWLQSAGRERDDRTEQERLRRRAAAAVGAIHGGDPHRAERARELLRERLRQRHADPGAG